MTCDKFEPAWNVFFTLFESYWPEYDGQIFLVTDSKQFDRPNVITLNHGFPKTPAYWSHILKWAIDQVDSEQLLLMLDDFFILRKVDNGRILEAYNWFQKHSNFKAIRLIPTPIPSHDKINEKFGEIKETETYRISTQAAIWDSKYLKSVLKEGESAWEFELIGTKRSNLVNGKVAVIWENNRAERPLLYMNSIVRGKLTRKNEKILSNLDVELDLTDIPVNNALEEYYWDAPTPIKHSLDYINKNIAKIMWHNKL